MKIHEIMTPNPRFIAPEQSLTEAAQVLRDLDVGAVPVCDNERVAGILTDRDIRQKPGEEALKEISEPAQPQR